MFRRFAYRLLCASVVFCVAGCATVHPPAHPVDPVSVYVADYGVHSAVMLPVSDNRYIEYAFGDWGYCAEDRDGPFDAIGALLVSNGSALGRRYIDLKPGEPYPMPKLEVPKVVFSVAVSRPAVAALEKKLEARYQRYACTLVHNPGNDTDYVRDGQHYSLFHSCNHLTADELRQMGCTVNGLTVSSMFHLAATQPAEGPTTTASTTW